MAASRTPGKTTEERGELGPAFFVLGLVTGLFAALVIERVTTTFLDRDVEFFRAVRELALSEYVREVDRDKLVDDALQGMLSGLDAHSRFYGPREIAQLDRETTGEFRGIGVVFLSPATGRVLFPYPGSPAAKAGLRVGDRIVEVDGAAVEAMEEGDLQAALGRNAEGIDLLVRGLEGVERDLVLVPANVIDPTVRHVRMLDDTRGIGYLAIVSFSHRTVGEFDAAVRALQKEELSALVVDLRYNPGGILQSAVQVANRFIAEGTIVSTRTRDEVRVNEAVAEEASLLDLPLVLLVDEGSASASEVLAGALQDHCAAVLVGVPTYGKGTVQTLKRFRGDRAIIKLTTADYFTPAQRRIERDPDDPDACGLSPDLMVELEDDERHAIHVFLLSYSPPPSALPALREWEDTEERELYRRPPEDRQLEAAVALLRGEPRELGAAALR